VLTAITIASTMMGIIVVLPMGRSLLLGDESLRRFGDLLMASSVELYG